MASYRMWDDRYGEEGYAYGTEPNVFLREIVSSDAIDLPQGSKCLMLAEGEGRNGVFLAGDANCRFDVTGVDSSEVGLRKAVELARSRNVQDKYHAVVGDLAEYDLGVERWDCIVGIFCHLPPPVRDRVLTAIPRALKPGGYAVFEAYTPAQLQYGTGGPPSAELMYSSDLFSKAFEGKLTVVRNDEVVRDVVEGKYHTGLAAVVQFVGRKDATSESP